MMKSAILTIGDELLIGQVLNSNVQWISEKLTDHSIQVTQHISVGDTHEAISSALDFLCPSVDVLFVGGGLGPTHDDVTMDSLSKYFNIPLLHDERWLTTVEAYFRARKRPMSPNNRKQALLLKDATCIDNDCGTAAGQYFIAKRANQNPIHIFVFPGVPHEMKSMMDRVILPTITTLQKNNNMNQSLLRKTLVLVGIGESALAMRCTDFVKKIQSDPRFTLAFLPSSTQLRLRLLMNTESQADTAVFDSYISELIEIAGKDFLGAEPVSLPALMIQKLDQKQQTLATVESCTGGLVAHLLTQVPGSSKVFLGGMIPYHTKLKEQWLGIEKQFIADHGVVSEQVATAMAIAIRDKMKSDFSVATTGYLGPTGGTLTTPIGTVCIAVCGPNFTSSKKFTFENNRVRNKERAAIAALDFLRRQME